MSRTYVILPLSSAAYAEIRAALENAGYDHAFHQDDGRLVIDLHGIAVCDRASEEWQPKSGKIS